MKVRILGDEEEAALGCAIPDCAIRIASQVEMRNMRGARIQVDELADEAAREILVEEQLQWRIK